MSVLCVSCAEPPRRFTSDIPQTGSSSGTDGKPVIFSYIDLNIQTLQTNSQLRSSVPAAPGGYSQASAAAASSAVTPGRHGHAAALRPGGILGGDAAAAASRDNILVSRLSAAFTRIAGQAANNAERVRLGVEVVGYRVLTTSHT